MSSAHANLIQGTRADAPFEARTQVAIVGAGAGGPAAALELARAGIDVIMVEEGGWYPPEFYRDLDPLLSFKHLYRDYGMTTAVGRNLLKDPAVPFPLGKCVGGTTAVNSGTCFRTPEFLLEQWRREFGLEVDLATLDSVFAEVEDILHVAEVTDAVLGANARVFARGAAKLGWGGAPLRRNAQGCRGSGRCVFGCPSNAKQGTHLSYVPRALAAGAHLVSDFRVERLLSNGDSIVGIEGYLLDRERNRPKQPARIMADAVIVAAGAVGTPLLLQRNGIAAGNKHLGRNLRLHPGIRVCALLDEVVNGWKGVPQGYYVDHFWHELGIMFEGIFVPPGVALPILPGVGAELLRRFEQYPHLAAFGAMVKDTASGSVQALGPRRQLIRYAITDLDKEHLVAAVCKASEAFFAAGAHTVFTGIYGAPELTKPDQIARLDPKRVRRTDLEMMAFHPMGTARMADSPEKGTCDPRGKVWGTRNLYVADASIFPTCLGVNPMESIMAFAHLIARNVAADIT